MIPRLVFVFALTALGCVACGGDSDGPSGTPSDTPPSLPAAVEYRQTPEGVTLEDPKFEPLPGASADYGTLGGAVYQIEMPDDWNGRLVLYMHGYAELAPVSNVGPPDTRRYLIDHGYAWGASSFSSTMLIPGRAADETAGLWDFFASKYERPEKTYITGESMGGAATHIAAERYPERFDGALALCGAAGVSPGLDSQTDYYAAGAFAAGLTQANFDERRDNHALVQEIRLGLLDPAKEEQFENIMIDLTGGPRSYDREGFGIERETNWLRAEQQATIGLADNMGREYELGAQSGVPSDEFNASVIRMEQNEGVRRSFTRGNDLTGEIKIPLLTMHTTGDWQVPLEQARIVREMVDAAGASDLLVQRVYRDPNHCGFALVEHEAAFEALVEWVENGVKPTGQDLLADFSTFDGEFELVAREDSPEAEAAVGAADRVTISGTATLDGEPFSATWIGARVRKDGLETPCQATLPQIDAGRFEITVMADSESVGCGGEGSEVLFWTHLRNQFVWSQQTLPWPGDGQTATFNPTFVFLDSYGVTYDAMESNGAVFDKDGNEMPHGTLVEAYIGDTLCGHASTRTTAEYSGYILAIVGPESIPECQVGATVEYRINGEPAVETRVYDRDDDEPLDLTLK